MPFSICTNDHCNNSFKLLYHIRYGLFVVKETGERRALGEAENPLELRVNLGPHEDIAKIYLMDKKETEEISHNTALYIKFSFAGEFKEIFVIK